MNVVTEIERRLQELKPLLVEVIDDSAKHAGHAGARDGGGHFRLRIIAACFSGLSVIARHRLVYDALGTLMQREIHALSIDASAPIPQNNPPNYQEIK
ncbi:MAG: BolA family transcriptional regulator [Rhodocyclaceae bacterium]|nr:BolA family transcriptional regulator [Rhodocyclaceae bacterium]MBK9623446.1 BolA family transcriptional regulator [Rhodocyclaceae bacterium]MBL0076060.1 BolA family transcriptional regulator [Rhodocyclaceae bacterium]MBP6108361.1 BolA family transcriptional regulator [Rhodocyclaceae bacterium]MBP6278377.1 BolA family transcriptional regulator [Rhodocyclaceae bacterium]